MHNLPHCFIGLRHRDEKKKGDILKHTKLNSLTKSIQTEIWMYHWLFSVDHANSTRNPFTVPQSDLVCVIRLKGILESSWPQSSKTWHKLWKQACFIPVLVSREKRDCFENRESKSPGPFRGWGVHLLRVQSVDLGHKTGWKKLFVYPLCIKTHLMWKMWRTDVMCSFLNQARTLHMNFPNQHPKNHAAHRHSSAPSDVSGSHDTVNGSHSVKSSFLPAKMVQSLGATNKIRQCWNEMKWVPRPC